LYDGVCKPIISIGRFLFSTTPSEGTLGEARVITDRQKGQQRHLCSLLEKWPRPQSQQPPHHLTTLVGATSGWALLPGAILPGIQERGQRQEEMV
jgi:hypothetical protein